MENTRFAREPALYYDAMWMVIALLIAQLPPGPLMTGKRVPAPSTWVSFSAELKITHPSRPTAFGRHVQDEHGCTRRETVNPDGTAMITITNYQTARTYTFGQGAWVSQEIRLIPGLAHRPPDSRVDELVKKIDGFDTYLSSIRITSPKGDSIGQRLVIPALNFFVPEQTRPDGETITAQNLRLGPIDHAEFLPPSGAHVEERPGMRAGQFSAVVVWIVFPDRPTIELTTTEERPMAVRTPLGETLQIVTTVVDHAKNVVRVRILKNAKASGPLGNVKGDELGEVHVALGGTVETTTLPENFAVSVRRIRDRYAEK